MDETYQVYVNRLVERTLPASYTSQLQNIQKSPKFVDGQVVSFPGYTVITPPSVDDQENTLFYQHLESIQSQLVQQLPPNLLIPLPPESFHFTLADLIWDRDYKAAVAENPNFETQLQKFISESFAKYQEIRSNESIDWQILGLLVFPRALVVGLVPTTEQAYQQVINLRMSIYQNSDLMRLGLEQKYYFAAHITLGYFNDIPVDLDRTALVKLLTSFNDQWLEKEPQVLTVKKAELRQFSDMTSYKRSTDWPYLEF